MNEIMTSLALKGNLENADFILLMNGMGNREIFNLSPNNVFEGITSSGVNFSLDGSIELKRKKERRFLKMVSARKSNSS